MKRVFLLVVTTFLLMMISIPTLAIEDNMQKVKGAYISTIDKNLNKIGTDEIDGNKYDIKDLKIESMRIEDNKLYIEGYIGEIDKVFNLVGNPKKVENTDQVINFQAEELSGQFEVLFVSLVRDVNKTTSYFTKFKNENPELDSMLKIYLKSENKKDLVLIEIFNPNIKGIEEIEKIRPSLELDESSIFWYTRYLRPVKNFKAKEMVDAIPSIKSGFANGKDHSFSHYHTYNHFGTYVTHYMKGVINTIMPSQVGTSEYTQVMVKILDEGVMYSNPDIPRLNNSSFELENVKIIASIDKGYAFDNMTLDGKVNKPAFAKIRFSIGVNSITLFEKKGISVGMEFGMSKMLDVNPYSMTFDNSSLRGYARQVAGKIPENYELRDVDHYFSVNMDLNKYDKESNTSRKTIEFLVSYFFRNDYDYRDSENIEHRITEYFY